MAHPLRWRLFVQTHVDQLIATHVEVAKRIALKMARRCPEHVSREDLVSAGLLGLTEAAKRYDSSRPQGFLPFAEQRIRGAVLDELRRSDILPRRVRQTARKIAATIRELEQHGNEASETQVASTLGVSVDNYRDNLATLLHAGTESIDTEGGTQIADQQSSPFDAAQRRELLGRVRQALDTLDKRDVTLLGLHYIEEMTFAEIGLTVGVSTSRACQLLGRAVSRLREALGPDVMQDVDA